MVLRWPQVPGTEAAAEIVRQSQHEIGFRDRLGSRRFAVRARVILAVEVEEAGPAVVARVEDIGPLPHELAAGLDHVPAVNNGHIVGIMPCGVREQLLRADVGVADGADVGEAGVASGGRAEASSPSPAPAMPSFWPILPRPLSAPPLLRVMLFTPARASFTSCRADGARPVQHAVRRTARYRKRYRRAATS